MVMAASFLLLFLLNSNLPPCINAAFSISAVLATNEPTLTIEPFLKIMPFGLTINTCPFAVIFPAISLRLLPVTRFKRASLLFC